MSLIVRMYRLSSLLLVAGFLCWSFPAQGSDKPTDRLTWDTKKNRVAAEVQSWPLGVLLENIASRTGWRVYVEPDTTRHVSANFTNAPMGEALKLLLGDLNYAYIPGAKPKLFVFKTAMGNATKLVSAPETAPGKPIPNELIVRLKPGANIDALARAVGAKVVGRIPELNAYRLRFDDEAAADAARTVIASNPDVAAVDHNYNLERPPDLQNGQGQLPPPVQLQLNPPPSNGRIIVGLIDTAVQPLGGNLDSFLLKQLSVAGPSVVDPDAPSHGTSMAETMLRSLQAMTKGSTSVQILPVDVYGPNQSTSTFSVAAGIVQAVNAGARVINLSLGSEGDSPFLHEVIQQVNQQNIPVFAAAGNEPTTLPYFPAAYPEVTAVTAMDHGQIAAYANRGSFVSLGAPGTSVIYFNGVPYYVTGTSSAAAFTSGVAAGYMETTHSSPAATKTFLQNAFGLNKPTGP